MASDGIRSTWWYIVVFLDSVDHTKRYTASILAATTSTAVRCIETCEEPLYLVPGPHASILAATISVSYAALRLAENLYAYDRPVALHRG
jgi:hypothetical protein